MSRLVTLAFLAAACGPTNPASDLLLAFDDLGTADLFGIDLYGADIPPPPADLVPNVYPAGPYGNTVGDTFPPLAWEGYVVPAADVIANTKPFGAYSADDVRMSGKTYAMIHVSDFF